MVKFDPSNDEVEEVLSLLPLEKEVLVDKIIGQLNTTEDYARSLIWNMKRIGLIYTNIKHQLDKV